jgi:2-keto-3-deoxy-L-rhamnonate aldolase RhmA
MRGKRIRDKLRAGRPVFTTVLKFHAPRLVEILARSGADQIFLDAEHGPLSEAECEEMVRAADLYDMPVAIRIPVNAPHVILRYLDIGTSAIMVPHVTTRADAERAVRAVKYPPRGRGALPRGVVSSFSVSVQPNTSGARTMRRSSTPCSRTWRGSTRSWRSAGSRASTAWLSASTTSPPPWDIRASRGGTTSRRSWSAFSRPAGAA